MLLVLVSSFTILHMNLNYKIPMYHNCQFKNDDTLEKIKTKVPFLSRENNQWLTQGYYFWASKKDAIRWNSQYPRTIVSEFLCTFEDDSYLYDLVGNSEHIDHFSAVARSLVESKIIPESDLTISGVIAYLRKKHKVTPDDVFKDTAIKASHSVMKSFPFIRCRVERLHSLNKQQFCIFENRKDFVKLELKNCYENKSAND